MTVFSKTFGFRHEDAIPAANAMYVDMAKRQGWAQRGKGCGVLVAVDENTYNPEGIFGKDLRIGEDHPMAWWHCEGKKRVLYSASGPRANAYAEPEYCTLLANAVGWATHRQGSECGALPATEQGQ